MTSSFMAPCTVDAFPRFSLFYSSFAGAFYPVSPTRMRMLRGNWIFLWIARSNCKGVCESSLFNPNAIVFLKSRI